MKKPCAIGVMLCALAGLGGCGHMPEFSWPFGREKPVPVAPPPVVEDIGPRVEAVPVEPVIQENMMAGEVLPAPAAEPVADEPFGF